MRRGIHGWLPVFGIGDEAAVSQLGQATMDLWQVQLLYYIHSFKTMSKASLYSAGIKEHLFKGHLF
jgi:hypothetical protein